MAYTAAPQGFFGPGYSESAAAITLKTSEAAGVTTGTSFSAAASTDVITTLAAHNLKVGDRIRVTEVGTLPAPLAVSTDYWVKTVPSATTLTISASKGGPTLDLTTDGSGANTMQAFGPLEELTDAEIDASTGDWRKAVFGIVEMLYQRWNNTPTADRPSKLAVSRSSSTNESTGVTTRFYTFQVQVASEAIEVVPE